MDKPKRTRGDAKWMEVPDAALLLESARTFPHDGPQGRTVGDRLGAAIGEVLGPGFVGESEFIRRMQGAGKLTDSERLRAYLRGDRLPMRD